ncbi:MAG: hypothetical protein ACRD2O_01935 [Terriglobia bacterium]
MKSVGWFLASVAYAKVLNESVKVTWSQEKNLAVKALTLGTAGTEDIDLGSEEERRRKADAEAVVLLRVFYAKLSRSSKAAGEFLEAQRQNRTRDLREIQEKLAKVKRANAQTVQEVYRYIKVLAAIELVCSLTVAIYAFAPVGAEEGAAATAAAARSSWVVRFLKALVPNTVPKVVVLSYAVITDLVDESATNDSGSVHLVVHTGLREAGKRTGEAGAKTLTDFLEEAAERSLDQFERQAQKTGRALDLELRKLATVRGVRRTRRLVRTIVRNSGKLESQEEKVLFHRFAVGVTKYGVDVVVLCGSFLESFERYKRQVSFSPGN